jgi:hypothetical protein
MDGFFDIPLPLIFLLSLIALLGAIEVGRLIGIRTVGRAKNNLATMEASSLGLLALMIGFTFSIALSSFDSRRIAVLDEANTITTTALRARMLPAPHNAEILNLLREYARIRLDVAQKQSSPSELEAVIARSNAINEMLWQRAKMVAAKDTAMVPTGLFIQSLNDMITTQAKRLTAVYDRVPTSVLLALYGIAIVACAFVGYADAREAQTRPSRLPMYIVGVTIAAVILLIQDLDRPRSGFITVNQQPMIDAAASLASYKD